MRQKKKKGGETRGAVKGRASIKGTLGQDGVGQNTENRKFAFGALRSDY
jgi:hypothetical protein